MSDCAACLHVGRALRILWLRYQADLQPDDVHTACSMHSALCPSTTYRSTEQCQQSLDGPPMGDAVGHVHMAALHLLAVRLPEEAVTAYMKAGLLREAATVASAQLLPGNSLLQQAHAAWGKSLADRGLHENAAAAFLVGAALDFCSTCQEVLIAVAACSERCTIV